MTDLDTLTDAFAELERRADAVDQHGGPGAPVRVPTKQRTRLLPVAASALTVLGVGAGVAVYAGNGDTDAQAGSSPATHSAGHAATAPRSAARSVSPTGRNGFQIPQTAAELAARFRVVLGDTATFTVRIGEPAHHSRISVETAGPSAPRVVINTPDGTARSGKALPDNKALPRSTTPQGAFIAGTLTAAGRTGGFDLQIFPSSPGASAQCDDPAESHCTIRRLPDGSSLAVGSEPLQNSSEAVTYQVDLVRSDGVEFLMHVSNERDPKGASPVLSAQPPLSRQQMVSIVTSERW